MRGAAAIGVLLVGLAGACAGPERGPDARMEAQRHPDVELVVDYGDAPFRVDVRYVDIISESVIAVRQGDGNGNGPRDRMTVTPSITPPGPGVPFADEAYRLVAVDIADQVLGRPPICVDGQRMRLARNQAAEARALYRDNRQTWVVFAFCPPVGEG